MTNRPSAWTVELSQVSNYVHINNFRNESCKTRKCVNFAYPHPFSKKEIDSRADSFSSRQHRPNNNTEWSIPTKKRWSAEYWRSHQKNTGSTAKSDLKLITDWELNRFNSHTCLISRNRYQNYHSSTRSCNEKLTQSNIMLSHLWQVCGINCMSTALMWYTGPGLFPAKNWPLTK